MIVDYTEMKPAQSEPEAIANIPVASVETLRSFEGLTGYLRNFVNDYSIIAALLT